MANEDATRRGEGVTTTGHYLNVGTGVRERKAYNY
jgi:hypothetical protein